MQRQRSTNPHQKGQPGTPVLQPADESSAPQQRGRRTGGRKNGEGTYDVHRGLPRFRASYTGPDGRTRSKELTAQTDKALRVKVRAWQAEIARGLPTEGENPALETVIDQWLATKVDLRANSLVDYTQIARRLKVGLGGHRVRELTDAHVQAWINKERKSGRAASTLTKTKALLHQILAYAEQRGRVFRNVARLVNVPKRDLIDPQVYDRAQVERLLAAATAPRQPGQHGRPPADWYALLAVHSWTGLRPSELLALKWGDVRWDDGVLYAQRGLLWPDSADAPVLSPMKNAYSRRQIPVPAFVLDALRAHRQAQHDLREVLHEGYDDWGLVFAVTTGTRVGGPMRERDVARAFQGVCLRAGLPRIPWYNLRHSYATILLDAGVPLHVVSGLMGHASVKITADIYGARAKRNTDVAAGYITRLAASPISGAPILAAVPALPAPAVEDTSALAASA